MLFEFIKYINTHWYYNLLPFSGVKYWVDYTLVDDDIKSDIDICKGYTSEVAVKNDAALQLWGKGIIIKDQDKMVPSVHTVTNVNDNYLFVRRHFSSFWSIYVLLIRLLALHNPIVELRGFFKALKAMPAKRPKPTTINNQITTDVSVLERSKPLISVIIPTLNRYNYLDDVLKDLEKQIYTNFEVIVCDQSDDFNESFYENRKLNLKVIRQQEKALWLARNQCVKASKGELVAFSEDDVRINPDWLVQHLRCLGGFDVDISAGVFYPEGGSIPADRAFYRWADQFATGNALVKKYVFEAVGLFDRQFEKMRSGDGEFGARCFMNGHLSVSTPYASCIDVKAPTGGLRQLGSWDSFRPTKFFAPRPVPSIIYYIRKYYGTKQALLMLISSVPGMLLPYQYRNSRKMLPLSMLAAVVLSPVLLMQMWISWRRAAHMLAEGAKIEELNL